MQKNLIYDVGMNNGDDTAYYLHRGFDVIAIEADPILTKEASSRFKEQIKTGQLQILNIGISETPGLFDFWVCDKRSEWNSFDISKASRLDHSHHSIKVECQTFDTILEKYGVPYYLKIDIEGKDICCLEALSPEDLPKYISIEVDSAFKLLTKLKTIGYKKFKCISQLNFLPVQLPEAKETKIFKRISWLNLPGRVIDKLIGKKIFSNRVLPTCWKNGWFFRVASSGSFGEDTPGKWLNYDKMMYACEFYKKLFDERKYSPFWRRDKYCSFWVDIHARRDN